MNMLRTPALRPSRRGPFLSPFGTFPPLLPNSGGPLKPGPCVRPEGRNIDAPNPTPINSPPEEFSPRFNLFYFFIYVFFLTNFSMYAGEMEMLLGVVGAMGWRAGKV